MTPFPRVENGPSCRLLAFLIKCFWEGLAGGRSPQSRQMRVHVVVVLQALSRNPASRGRAHTPSRKLARAHRCSQQPSPRGRGADMGVRLPAAREALPLTETPGPPHWANLKTKERARHFRSMRCVMTGFQVGKPCVLTSSS